MTRKRVTPRGGPLPESLADLSLGERAEDCGWRAGWDGLAEIPPPRLSAEAVRMWLSGRRAGMADRARYVEVKAAKIARGQKPYGELKTFTDAPGHRLVLGEHPWTITRGVDPSDP